MNKFNPLTLSSKFHICGLPIRVDTYKTCTFGCTYCFSNCRKIMTTDDFAIGDINCVERKLKKVFDDQLVSEHNFLDTLLAGRYTWHCGGLSDPFQPCEQVYHVTRDLVDLTNKYRINILFSTKADTLWDVPVDPNLHTFQLSVTNTQSNKDVEPNVPDFEKRLMFYNRLKADGFKVGIRIQPFLPGITTTDIVDYFRDADQFTIEGLKLVPQNLDAYTEILRLCNLRQADFTCYGLMNLKPMIRYRLYKPFIEQFEKYGIPYSIADNDLRHFGNNVCCCGDRLVSKSYNCNPTAFIQSFGTKYTLEQVLSSIEYEGTSNCQCHHLFTSNRQLDVKTVKDYYIKNFDRSDSLISPDFQNYPQYQKVPKKFV